MAVKTLTEPLGDVLARSSPVVLEDLPELGLAYLLARDLVKRPLLAVCPDESVAAALAQDLEALTDSPVHLLLGDAHTAFEPMAPDPRAAFSRFVLRHAILRGQAPQWIVATAAAVQGRWFDDTTFAEACLQLYVGEDIDRDAVAQHFLMCGYQPVAMVEDEGTFAVRGGVVDIFVPGQPRPWRPGFPTHRRSASATPRCRSMYCPSG